MFDVFMVMSDQVRLYDVWCILYGVRTHSSTTGFRCIRCYAARQDAPVAHYRGPDAICITIIRIDARKPDQNAASRDETSKTVVASTSVASTEESS